MSHKRTLIRKACVQSLKGHTAAGANVLSNRTAPIFGTMELPAINITTSDETSQPDTVSDAPTLRTLDLALDLIRPADNAGSIDDELDDFAKEVEDIMSDTNALGDDAIDAVLDSSAMDLGQIGEQLVGVIRLIYKVTYRA